MILLIISCFVESIKSPIDEHLRSESSVNSDLLKSYLNYCHISATQQKYCHFYHLQQRHVPKKVLPPTKPRLFCPPRQLVDAETGRTLGVSYHSMQTCVKLARENTDVTGNCTVSLSE